MSAVEQAGHQDDSERQADGHIGRFAVNFVLIEPSHPGNVGSAARALQVMGFERFTVVKPRYPDMWKHRAAVAFASGATRVLGQCVEVATLAEAVAGSRLTVAVSAAGRRFAPEPESPRQIGQSIKALLTEVHAGDPSAVAGGTPAPVALVFGTERTGLSVEQAQQCGRLCSIEAEPGYSSLNLAQALQIMAYEMRLALCEPPAPVVAAPRHHEELPATHAQIEGMIAHLEQSLIAIDYLDPAEPKWLMARLRNLFSRAVPSSKEIDILRGICHKMARPNGARAHSERIKK